MPLCPPTSTLSVSAVSSAYRKKQNELFLFERFAEAAKLSPEIIDSENECPDLVVRLSGEIVGIEITELFVSEVAGGASLQAHESIAQRIVSKAHRIYEASGPPYAHVSVLFATGYDLGSLNRDKTAESLAKLIWERLVLSPVLRISMVRAPSLLTG